LKLGRRDFGEKKNMGLKVPSQGEAASLPPFSEEDIRAWVGSKSFQRGQEYFDQGRIYQAQRRGRMLRAHCEGSGGNDYRLQVTFGDQGLEEADCTCPVGDGGHCKHIAALLLSWLHRAEEFVELEDLEAALEQRSKAELIALIKLMLRREPDLEVLLGTPLPMGGQVSPRPSVDAKIYQRLAAAAFRHAGGGWGVESEIAAELDTVVGMGNEFAAQQDFANAAVVYQAVAEEVLEQYEMYHDEGDLSQVVNDCVEGLGRCLAGSSDPSTRENILRALFDIYAFDVDFGGIGLADEVPEWVLEQASREERARVAEWIRDRLLRKAGFGSDWRRQTYGGFLLALEQEEMDDETYLQICRETHRLEDLVDRLLALGRLDEAVAEAERAGDYDLLQLAEVFVAHRQGEAAERLLADRSRTSPDTRLVEWLKNHYQQRGDLAGALDLAHQLFQKQASLATYQEVRTLARKLGSWDSLRPKLMAQLEAAKHHSLLVDIYLDEGQIDAALAALSQASSAYYSTLDQRVRVAQAAEKTRPDAALDLYRSLVEGAIRQRQRPSYHEACEYLKRMRSLYQALHQEATWERYIADLRQNYRTLRALQDELNKARL